MWNPEVAKKPPLHGEGSLVPVLLRQLHPVVTVNAVQGVLELPSRDRLGDLCSRPCVV